MHFGNAERMTCSDSLSKMGHHRRWKMTKDDKLDYNERADGYGSAGAESEHKELPYEKKREQTKEATPKAPTKDEHGQPNQHGEVDQYSFRNKLN